MKPPSTCIKMFDHAGLYTEVRAFKLRHLLSKWSIFLVFLVISSFQWDDRPRIHASICLMARTSILGGHDRPLGRKIDECALCMLLDIWRSSIWYLSKIPFTFCRMSFVKRETTRWWLHILFMFIPIRGRRHGHLIYPAFLCRPKPGLQISNFQCFNGRQVEILWGWVTTSQHDN